MNANISLTVDSVFEAARKLPLDDQYALCNRLEDELHGCPTPDNDSELSPEWKAELQRRLAEDEAGEAEWIPASEVIRELRESLSRPA